MTDDFKIPMVSFYGPGSQPLQEAEDQLEYVTMPKDMTTYHQPQLPEPEDAGDIGAGLALLRQVAQALEQHPQQGNATFSFAGLNADSLQLINQVLGVGEVSATIDGACNGNAPIHIQEGVMAGVWRVQQLDGNGEGRGVLQWDGIETGAIPRCVMELAFANARTELDTSIANVPGLLEHGPLMNAPSLLAELSEHIRTGANPDGASHDTPHVINLTLLPLNAADLYCIGERLGVGPVTLLSRGYGNCRIGSTACKDVWWIKYFNSEDSLILNTIEVVKVPEVALAAPEDIADSAHRMQEILELYN